MATSRGRDHSLDKNYTLLAIQGDDIILATTGLRVPSIGDTQ